MQMKYKKWKLEKKPLTFYLSVPSFHKIKNK